MNMNDRRLIEATFPLKQASLDSVHEKNVRHGHISTLHIWPARRPLAACRAALIATLLPDPGNDEERKKLLEKIGGTLDKTVKKKKLPNGKIEEKVVEETKGGILHWGRESNNDIEWFRQKIREAYGGRAPKVLDPFAGGGAIPLEAMRLGCEVTAADINPVAWFILKCTLEYPQKLAEQKRPLPEFALKNPVFMSEFLKTNLGSPSVKKATKKQQMNMLHHVNDGSFQVPEADLAWHVRAWGSWVLEKAKVDLEKFYPTIDGKPTVAYLWARTVVCKNCRAMIPLLKTRWLCKKENKRVLLTMEPNPEKTGVIFGIQNDVPSEKGNNAQRRENDKKIGAGTMSRSGAKCPNCPTIMTMEDIRLEGKAGRLGNLMTAVVVDGKNGKEYRLSNEQEFRLAKEAANPVEEIFRDNPFRLPTEAIVENAKRDTWCVPYGFNMFSKLFTPRQLLALGSFIRHTRNLPSILRDLRYPEEWVEAITSFAALAISRCTDRLSTVCHWSLGRETIQNTFSRFALPVAWDYSEANPIGSASGSYDGHIEWLAEVASHCMAAENNAPLSKCVKASVTSGMLHGPCDIIITDPPYYDAIGYSVLMDFFYVWLRRILFGFSPLFDTVFCDELSPKWSHEKIDGELVDDAHRFSGNRAKAKENYEKGMAKAFRTCFDSLVSEGRLVVVFANKQPDAWETLVSAIIQAGFTVDGSWPIQTEMTNRTRALSSAALASSVWLVCKKRPETARPGWDNQVLDEMRQNIAKRLREFWDAGIRGPDFVWAATGPALEAYSKHPVVKKANDPDQVLTVSEFLKHVRRIVVDFVVGRVLSRDGEESAASLDDLTTYYLLHRYDFGMEEAPVGACILYAISCGLSDKALVDQYDLLIRKGKQNEDEDEPEEEEDEVGESSGSKVKLKSWQQRKKKSMGYEAPAGGSIPYIDQIHRLMHLWKAGSAAEVDDYLNAQGLQQNALFHHLLQSLIELADEGTEERSTLESISNHISAGGIVPKTYEQERIKS